MLPRRAWRMDWWPEACCAGEEQEGAGRGRGSAQERRTGAGGRGPGPAGLVALWPRWPCRCRTRRCRTHLSAARAVGKVVGVGVGVEVWVARLVGQVLGVHVADGAARAHLRKLERARALLALVIVLASGRRTRGAGPRGRVLGQLRQLGRKLDLLAVLLGRRPRHAGRGRRRGGGRRRGDGVKAAVVISTAGAVEAAQVGRQAGLAHARRLRLLHVAGLGVQAARGGCGRTQGSA
jgi:hypothetical protein